MSTSWDVVVIGAGAAGLLAALGSFFVMAAIFAVNDWADIHLDLQNTLKRENTFLEKGIKPGHMLALAISLAAAGITIFARLSGLHVVIATAALLFGVVYSVPIRGVRGKSIPVFSSLLHFAGTLLAFLLGALTYAPASWSNLMVGAYPAVLITAGHLIQEVEDYEEDRISGCQTNAVRYGRKAIFISGSVLFGLSFLLLFWLARQGLLPGVIQYAPILYLPYVAFGTQAHRAGLSRDSVRRLRRQYRLLFAVVILAILISSLRSKMAF